MSKQKILLLNCPQSEKIEELSTEGVTFDMINILTNDTFSNIWSDKPISFYEYDIVFFNTDNIGEISIDLIDKEEYKICDTFFKDLEKFYRYQGILVFIIGSGINNVVESCGLKYITFEHARKGDTKYILAKKEIYSIVKENMQAPEYYYTTGRNLTKESTEKFISSFSESDEEKGIQNLNNDIIALSHKYYKHERDIETLYFIPQIKLYKPVVSSILKYFANSLEDFLPQYRTISWIKENKYLSTKAKKLINTKNREQKALEKKILNIENKINKENKNFENIKKLLYSKNEDFKLIVKQNLESILGLSVVDLDEKIKGPKKEDLFFKYAGNTYTIETKGTVAENPSPSYITKLITHTQKRLRANDFEGELISILVLNYNIPTPPEQRRGAYLLEEDENLLKDNQILFIDSYELFKLLRSVYDKRIDKNEAAKNLLKDSKGRYTFSEK